MKGLDPIPNCVGADSCRHKNNWLLQQYATYNIPVSTPLLAHVWTERLFCSPGQQAGETGRYPVTQFVPQRCLVQLLQPTHLYWLIHNQTNSLMSQHPTPTLQAQQNKNARNSRQNTWTTKVCVRAMLWMEKQHTRGTGQAWRYISMYCRPWHQMQESNQLHITNFNPKLGDFKAPKQLPPLR